MKETSDVVACVIDRGVFFSAAERLARDFKKVYYHRPNGEDSTTFAQSIKGDGHPNVEYTDDFWPLKDEIDLFVFPDCVDGGLQVFLESQGKAVWGSKRAGELERMRGRWIGVCEKYGMPVPETHEVIGLDKLKLFLMQHEGETYFVKISKYRGDMETWKAEDPEEIANQIDYLRLKFGPFQDLIRFYVQKSIDTEIEGGCDTYFCAGQFPSKIVLGYEKKAKGYFATWRERAEMPPEIWAVTEKIAPLLAGHNYCNLITSEVRVADGKSYWLDPCFRFPSPASEQQLELYGNFGDIVWQGANGVFVEPQMTAKFSGGAVISYTGQRDCWKAVSVPEEVRDSVKLFAYGYHEGYAVFPPSQEPESIGWAVATADTPAGVLDGLKEIKESLADAPVELHLTEIADLFTQIESAEEQGIPFSEHAIPDPADVIE
jgi:hypothetical protein